MVLEIKKAVKCLDNGGIIIYPSDTLWAIGCDATNQSSIDKIYKITLSSSKDYLGYF